MREGGREHLRLVVSQDDERLVGPQLARVRRQADIHNRLCEQGLKPPTWEFGHGAYVVECRRGGYRKEESEFEYKHRAIEFRVRNAGVTCAVADFVEWKAPDDPETDDFFYEADAISQDEADFAAVITGCWNWFGRPFDYGTAVRVNLVFIDRRKGKSDTSWEYIERAIQREFGKRAAALLVEAIPMNYTVPKHWWTQRPENALRLAATKRLAARRLGVELVPGKWGQRGWMWTAIRYCPRPEEQITQDL
jgi:hypothetical protein